jgi:ATP-dependent Clp protease adaptor protein ClpS
MPPEMPVIANAVCPPIWVDVFDVVIVLRKYFNKSVEEATRIMLHVHNHGVGECGVYTYEVAETKVTQVMDFARKHQHPLQCIMEKK